MIFGSIGIEGTEKIIFLPLSSGCNVWTCFYVVTSNLCEKFKDKKLSKLNSFFGGCLYLIIVKAVFASFKLIPPGIKLFYEF